MATPEREARIRQVAAARQRGAVVLEDVHDPHNAAAVLRCCDSFGFQIVHFLFVRERPYNPRKIGRESSSSANRWLDFVIHSSVEDCLEGLHAEGYETVATTLDPAAESLFEATFPIADTAFLFGNEHRGLSETALRLARRRIRIPMVGMVQSLNLSVTAGICLFELSRQRRARPEDAGRLDQTQLDRLTEQWLRRER